MELKDIVEPKWALATKRGWGMLLAGVSTVLPFVNEYTKGKWGVSIDAPVVALAGEVGANLIDAVGLAVGYGLWIWGTFRPSAPLTVLPPKADAPAAPAA